MTSKSPRYSSSKVILRPDPQKLFWIQTEGQNSCRHCVEIVKIPSFRLQDGFTFEKEISKIIPLFQAALEVSGDRIKSLGE